jgi:hypothetical protein
MLAIPFLISELRYNADLSNSCRLALFALRVQVTILIIHMGKVPMIDKASYEMERFLTGCSELTHHTVMLKYNI